MHRPWTPSLSALFAIFVAFGACGSNSHKGSSSGDGGPPSAGSCSGSPSGPAGSPGWGPACDSGDDFTTADCRGGDAGGDSDGNAIATLAQLDSYVDGVNAGHMGTPDMADVSTNLTCGFDVLAAVPATSWISGSSAYTNVLAGFASKFGGIGVTFQLVDPRNPGSAVDVLEARSSAGAAWQSSPMGWPGTSGTLYNIDQSDGNQVDMQWGYDANLQAEASTLGEWVRSGSWTPNASGEIGGTGVSPCPQHPNSQVFTNGAVAYSMIPVPTAYGSVISIRNQYSSYALADEYWAEKWGMTAFYMSKHVAAQANLRVYAGSRTRGWHAGPMYPASDFSTTPALYDQNGTERGSYQMLDPGTGWAGINLEASQGADYWVMAWNILGRDVALVLYSPTPFQGISGIHESDTTYCTDASDPTCGSVDLMVVLEDKSGLTYSAATIDSFESRYLVGSPAQIQPLGFQIGDLK